MHREAVIQLGMSSVASLAKNGPKLALSERP